MRVLLVDDDADLLELTTYALRREGYTVLGATNGQQALHRWATEAPDIVLLDVNLPKLNGFDVCRQVRHESQTPVIMLTARTDEEDILRGFRLGADDYIVKPFSPRQLTARMKALLRRCQSDPYREPVGELRVGDLVIDLQTHEARKGDEIVQLTPLEFRILYLLAMNVGRVIPHARLIDYAWDYDGGDASLLKTHICHLRRKLRLSADKPGGIRVVVGVGYSLSRP
jgi:DNA-binding response OmpR family regulator